MRNTQAKKNRTYIYILLILVLIGLIAATVFLLSGLSSRAAVVREAEAHRFLTARSNMFDAVFVSSKLQKYVEAGVLYENKSYTAAENRFRELGNYRDSDYMANECRIRDVYKRSLLGGLNPDIYFELKDMTKQLSRYGELVKLAQNYIDDLKPQLYELAAAAYRNGDYAKAQQYFAEFDQTYKRTQSYNVLITCHQVLKEDSEDVTVQACYDALLSCLDLEDAAQLILSNTAIAEKFLEGTWRSADNRYRFILYQELVEPEEPEETMQMGIPVIIDPDAPGYEPAAPQPAEEEGTEEKTEEYVFKTEHNLPNFGVREESFKISGCVYSCSDGRARDKDTFRIGIMNKDTVVFYCFYNGSRITLERRA